MRIRNVLIVYPKSLPRGEKAVLHRVHDCLRRVYSCRVSVRKVDRDSLKSVSIKNNSLLVSFGGDGTFLRASRYSSSSSLVLGINSNLRKKEGFFTRANRHNFEEKIRNIFAGKFSVIRLPALKATVRNRILGFGVNDIYFGSYRAYKTSRYKISIGRISEVHRSSGIIFSTPAGSNAWSLAAGGKRLDIGTESSFQFVVRETYNGKIFKSRLKTGLLRKPGAARITSMMSDGCLSFDSMDDIVRLKQGDSVRIGLSDRFINMVDV